MKPEYVALVSGVVGTLLGAVVSFVSIWLQQRAQEKRDRAKLAMDAAVKEYDSAEKYAEFMAKQGQRIVTHDLGYYIVLHNQLAQYLYSDGELTKEKWVAAHTKAIEISEAGVEFYRQQKSSSPGTSGPSA